jgi:hypothetical protein
LVANSLNLPFVCRSAHIKGEQRQANFRSGSPLHQFGGSVFLSPPATIAGSNPPPLLAPNQPRPPTGLSLLMNGDVQKPLDAATNHASTASLSSSNSAPNITKLSYLSPTQRQRYQQEMAERDNQASSLAAAGMVAESVSLTTASMPTTPTGNTLQGTPISEKPSLPIMGLQPPPTILAQSVPSSNSGATAAPTTELDSIDWNFMDIGSMHIDDMDMDFATLFDPANELSNLHSRGSGVFPSSSSSLEASAIPAAPMLVNHQDWSTKSESGATQSGQQPSGNQAP